MSKYTDIRNQVINTSLQSTFNTFGEVGAVVMQEAAKANEEMPQATGAQKFAKVKNTLVNEVKLQAPNFIMNLLINLAAAILKK